MRSDRAPGSLRTQIESFAGSALEQPPSEMVVDFEPARLGIVRLTRRRDCPGGHKTMGREELVKRECRLIDDRRNRERGAAKTKSSSISFRFKRNLGTFGHHKSKQHAVVASRYLKEGRVLRMTTEQLHEQTLSVQACSHSADLTLPSMMMHSLYRPFLIGDGGRRAAKQPWIKMYVPFHVLRPSATM